MTTIMINLRFHLRKIFHESLNIGDEVIDIRVNKDLLSMLELYTFAFESDYAT